MSMNKNTEYVINLENNTNTLLVEYQKCYSIFALLPVRYKINYIIICLALSIIGLSCVIMIEKPVIGIVLCVIFAILFIFTNVVHVSYINNYSNEIHLARYRFLKDKLSMYDAFALRCLNEKIKDKREKSNFNVIGLIIATFAVILLPIWESYVSIYFEKNIIGTESDTQIKNFLFVVILSIVLLFTCIGIYILANAISNMFRKDRFYDNLCDIIKAIIEEKENNGDDGESP